MLIKLILILITLNSTYAAKTNSFDASKYRFQVTKKVFPNGLTLLIYEDHRVPTVTYQTWFRVGSKNEEVGFTGIAHLFEHMMFKGAKRYSRDAFEGLLHANGITNNAFTTQDYTSYFEDLPPNKLELVIDIESDRMENLQLNQSNLTSEREVVKEERRWRVDNSISGSLFETLSANAYTVHPYRWPVIGWMKDIDAITLEKCKAFFKTYYSVSNAVIVVAGDVKIDNVISLVEKYYGKLPKVDVPKLNAPQDPPQKIEKTITLKKDSQVGYVAMAYKIGRQGEKDSFVMDLISNILTEGKSSRLYKKLVYDTRIASGIDGSSFTPEDPGIFELLAELKPSGATHAEAIKQMTAEINKIIEGQVTARELEKAKNQVMKQWVDGIKTVHGKARLLGLNEVVTGKYENAFDDLDQYEKITLSDVSRVAKKYLQTSNRTVVLLQPEKKAQK